MYKRKAVESAQTAADLKLHLDKYHAQLKEVQVAVSEKTSTLQQQSFKFKRIQVCVVWSFSCLCYHDFLFCTAFHNLLYVCKLVQDDRLMALTDLAWSYAAV